MTDDIIRQSIQEKTGEIDRWADGTKQLVGEIRTFLNELQESGFVMPEKAAASYRDVEKSLTDVTGYLEDLKEVMTDVRKITGG